MQRLIDIGFTSDIGTDPASLRVISRGQFGGDGAELHRMTAAYLLHLDSLLGLTLQSVSMPALASASTLSVTRETIGDIVPQPLLEVGVTVGATQLELLKVQLSTHL